MIVFEVGGGWLYRVVSFVMGFCILRVLGSYYLSRGMILYLCFENISLVILWKSIWVG